MKMFQNVLGCLALMLMSGGGVGYADYVWDADTTGRLTDACWNNGQASPFDASYTTTANQGIIVSSGTISTGGMILNTNGTSLGDAPDYANRTVFRLQGGTLQFDANATAFTINAGSGFIQSGGTLSIDAPNLVLSISGTKVQNVLSSGTLNISQLTLYAGDSNLELGATTTLKTLDTRSGSRLVIAGTTQVNPETDLSLGGTIQVKTDGSLNFNRTFNIINNDQFLVDGGSVSTTGNLNVANMGTSSLEITSGSILAANFRIGNNAGSSGTMSMSGGTVNVGGDWSDTSGVHVGQAGTGTFTMTGGTVNGTYFTIGNTGTGTMVLGEGVNGESGTLDLANSLYLGRSTGGSGTFTFSAGTVDIGQNLVIGQGGTGTMVQNGGAVRIGLEQGVYQEFYIGRNAGSQGKYTLNAGTVEVLGTAYWGNEGTANIILNGGTVSVAGNMYAGFKNKATVLMTGGTVNVEGRLYLNSTDGDTTNGSVEWTVNGGTLNVTKGLSICNATLNITGGEVISGSGTELAFNVPNKSINLSGGKLTVNHNIIFHASSTGSSINVSGGELFVTGDYTVNSASTLNFDVRNEQLGKVTIHGNATFASGNTVNLSSAGVMSIAETSHDLLTVGSGNLDTFTIHDNSPLWNAARGTGKITLTLAEANGSYTVDSGWLRLEDGLDVGVIAVEANSDPYNLIFSTEGVGDTDEFLTWLNENSSLEVTSLGDSLWQVGLFAADFPTHFAWDFSSYANGAVTLTGLAGQSVPEPQTWLLLLLAGTLVAGWKRGFLRKSC
ncbi:MAG: hypothetical protein Q4D62_07760 [Planctomycetia bacterium]|nr:hypothetical protein [Planctomycetia bacterium]